MTDQTKPAAPVCDQMSGERKPWHGSGECPEHPDSQIVPTYRGPAKPEGSRITCAPAARLDWSHDGSNDDIVSYIVSFDASLAAYPFASVIANQENSLRSQPEPSDPVVTQDYAGADTVGRGVRNALIARADKYLHTGSGEFASEIMRDMAEFIRKLPSARPSEAAVAWRWYRDGVIVTITEAEARHVFDRWQFLSDDRGSATLMLKQLWAEIDRLRTLFASPPDGAVRAHETMTSVLADRVIGEPTGSK